MKLNLPTARLTTAAVAALLALLVTSAAQTQTLPQSPPRNVDVKDAWVRTSVPGQKASGAFMTLTAKDATRLVGASSPVAGVVEVHEMKMEGDVMKMRAVTGGLELPAGKAMALSPGGYHIMLLDLKAALPKDSTIPLTLVFKDAKGVESRLELKVPVSAVSPRNKSASDSRAN